MAPYIFNNSREHSIEDVVLGRHSSLQSAGIVARLKVSEPELVPLERMGLAHAPALLRAGRLVVWHRDLTVDDGAGEAETGGFLDESDMPPWDSWITYVDPSADPGVSTGYLVAWVPPVFVGPVSAAIAVNAYDALYWLEGTSLLAARALSEIGCLA